MFQKLLKILIFTLTISIILGATVDNDCEEISIYLKKKYNNISYCYYLGYPGRLDKITINNDGSFTKDDFKKIFSYETLEQLTIVLENNKNANDPYTLYPSEISQLKNVKELKIINNTGAAEITKQFAFSNTLEDLNLTNFIFKLPLDFPNTLKKLSLSSVTFEKPLDFPNTLKKLSLSNVTFEKPLEFPNTLEELSLTDITFTMPLVLPNSIKILYISNFKYDFSYIASLTKLESLNIEFKSDIPSNDKMSPLKNLTNVKAISFAGGEKRVTEIPEFIYSLKNIEELDISSQDIKKIPENLCTLTHLKKLNFYNNELEGTLPECLNNLSSLSYVDFSSNSKLEGNALNDVDEWCNYDYTDVKFDPDMQCIGNLRNNSGVVYSKYEKRSFIFTVLIFLAMIIGLIVAVILIIVYYIKQNIKGKNNGMKEFSLILLIIIIILIIIYLINSLLLFIISKSYIT